MAGAHELGRVVGRLSRVVERPRGAPDEVGGEAREAERGEREQRGERLHPRGRGGALALQDPAQADEADHAAEADLRLTTGTCQERLFPGSVLCPGKTLLAHSVV